MNQGSATATGSWVDRIYLYSSPSGANPVLLGSVPFTGILAVGKSVPISSTVNLPTSQPGSFYVGVTTDYFDLVSVPSTTGQNTTISSQLTLIEAPDLVAESPQSSVNTIQFGQPISVTWTVQNNGNATASGSWVDQIYLSSQPTLNANSTPLYQQSETANSPLAVGASYTAARRK